MKRMIFLAGLTLGCAPASPEPPEEHGLKRFEASGVVRFQNDLLLVHDEVAGAYFRLPVEEPLGIHTYKPKAALIERIAGADGAQDLEGIALGDGQVFVLSEALGALVAKDGTFYQYADFAQPIGNRGLEGLAIQKDAAGVERVAALFEGGFLKKDQLPKDQEEEFAGRYLNPFVIIHELPAIGMRASQVMDGSVQRVDLQLDDLSGELLGGHRFRAVDLVWQPLDGAEWGWIVLLSSDAAPDSDVKGTQLWLQRFDARGAPLGEHIDLGDWLKEQGKKFADEDDWEGLGWWQRGRVLVLVDDTEKQKSHVAFVPIPEAWKIQK